MNPKWAPYTLVLSTDVVLTILLRYLDFVTKVFSQSNVLVYLAHFNSISITFTLE